MCVVFTVRNVSDLQSKVAFSVEVYHRNLNNKIDKRNTVLCVVGNYCRQLCVLMLCTIRVFARHVCVCVYRAGYALRTNLPLWKMPAYFNVKVNGEVISRSTRTYIYNVSVRFLSLSRFTRYTFFFFSLLFFFRLADEF